MSVYNSASKRGGANSIGSYHLSNQNYLSYNSALPLAPENLNNLYASYNGTYAKTYIPSFNGTFRNRSCMNSILLQGTTREENN